MSEFFIVSQIWFAALFCVNNKKDQKFCYFLGCINFLIYALLNYIKF